MCVVRLSGLVVQRDEGGRYVSADLSKDMSCGVKGSKGIRLVERVCLFK